MDELGGALQLCDPPASSSDLGTRVANRQGVERLGNLAVSLQIGAIRLVLIGVAVAISASPLACYYRRDWFDLGFTAVSGLLITISLLADSEMRLFYLLAIPFSSRTLFLFNERGVSLVFDQCKQLTQYSRCLTDQLLHIPTLPCALVESTMFQIINVSQQADASIF